MAQADFTWSGAAPGGQPFWSNASNWVGGTAPSGNVGTLSFPALRSSACISSPETDTCYQSENDVSGLHPNSVSIEDGLHGFGATAYAISGAGISLGAGGITAAPTEMYDYGGGGASINLPIVLAADQTWSITGSDLGAWLSVGGAVTGRTAKLTVNLRLGTHLSLYADDEVGSVTVTGSGSGPGYVGLGPGTTGTLNFADGNPVSFGGGTDLYADPGRTGPLTMSGGVVGVGQTYSTTAAQNQLSVNGAVSLDSSSQLAMYINQAGTSAGTDYSQLHASGNVNLGGAALILSGSCSQLHIGDVLSLVTTAGSLNGTFSALPDGSTASVPCSHGTPTVRIHYTPNSVTATVLTGFNEEPTTTALTAPASAVTNEPVTLGSMVAASSGTPTGTVRFDNHGAPILGCTARPLNNSGAATCRTSFAADSSPESLTATYMPSSGSGFQGSSSSPMALSVGKDSTTTALAVSNGNPNVGQGVTFTATVTPGHAGAVFPSGSVKFFDGGSAISSCSSQPLTGTKATCTVTYASPGLHSITASYAGDTNFTGSPSPAQTVTVSGGTPTTTSLAPPSPSSPLTNQVVTLSATVTASSGTATPTGTMAFFDSTGPIAGCGSQPLSGTGTSPTATCQTSYAAASSPEQLSASYTPTSGSNFQSSRTTGRTTLAIGQDGTASALSVSSAAPNVGDSVAYTAMVSPADPGPVQPSGSVAFLDGGSAIPGCGAQPLSGGQATCTVSYSSAGSHSVSTSYSGDANFTGSTSPAQTVTVSQPSAPTPPPTTPTSTPTTTPPITTPPITTPPASGQQGAVALPSVAQIEAALNGVLVPGGKKAKIAAILKAGGYTFSFTPPSAGQLNLGWYQLPKGAHLAKKSQPVFAGTVTVSISKTGTLEVKIKLTPAGRRLLKHANKQKLTAKDSFTPTGGSTVTERKTFTLKR